MAKLSFAKLGIKPNTTVESFAFGEHTVEVKQYLPLKEKTELISKVINFSEDDNRFYNPIKIDMFLILNVIEYYTNINFTSKQKDDPSKIYDEVVSSGLWNEIIKLINPEELTTIKSYTYEIIESIYNYNNSAHGIMSAITQDYENLNLDAADIASKLSDPNNLEMLKGVLTKMG